MLEDGKTAPAKVKMLSVDKKKQTAIIEITIHEGSNRQVRRMFEAIGHEVLKLKRERYGFLTLHGLSAGDARELTPHEVKQLRALAMESTKEKFIKLSQLTSMHFHYVNNEKWYNLDKLMSK